MHEIERLTLAGIPRMNPELQANGSNFLGFPEGLTRWWPVACDLGPE
jgi:hypothetical protein